MTLQWHTEARTLREQGWKQTAIAAKFGCSDAMVSKICSRDYIAAADKPINDESVLSLWKAGCNTMFISQLLNCSEASVYNRLAKVRG
jgi:hypothetical protein